MRAFFAIDFPDAIKDAYREVLEDLRAGYATMRWVAPENLHLTLRFLGQARDDEIEALKEPVAELAASHKPIRVGFGAGGCFGPRSAPQALWIGIADGAKQLERLQIRLEDIVCRHGFRPEVRAWVPHLTLGRFSVRGAGGKGRPALTAALWSEAVGCLGLDQLWFDLREIMLFSSVLRPEGPTYSPVWRAPLGVN